MTGRQYSSPTLSWIQIVKIFRNLLSQQIILLYCTLRFSSRSSTQIAITYIQQLLRNKHMNNLHSHSQQTNPLKLTHHLQSIFFNSSKPQLQAANTNNTKKQKDYYKGTYGERKNLNIGRIRGYIARRISSMDSRAHLWQLLTSNLISKYKNTVDFCHRLIRDFEDFRAMFAEMGQGLRTIDLKKKCKGKVTQTGIKNAIQEVIQLNQKASLQYCEFAAWVNSYLIDGVRDLEQKFAHKMRMEIQQMEGLDKQFQHSYQKQRKLGQKLSEGNDLLQKQLGFLEQLKDTNQAAVLKSAQIYQSWETLLQEEQFLKERVIIFTEQFSTRLREVHAKEKQRETEGADQEKSQIIKWRNNVDPPGISQIFQSFLTAKDLQCIAYGSTQDQPFTIKMENYMRLRYEDQRIGNPFDLLEILTVKSMKGKLQIQNPSAWKDTRLFFTVDSHLLVYDEKQQKSDFKLKFQKIKISKLLANIVEIEGVSESFIFNSRKKIKIRFETLDEVEELAYLIQEISPY